MSVYFFPCPLRLLHRLPWVLAKRPDSYICQIPTFAVFSPLAFTSLSPCLLTGQSANRAGAVKLAAWVTKALAQRGLSESRIFAALLLEALADAPQDSAAADAAVDGIRLLIADDAGPLSRAFHGTCRLMYKQRFFLEQLPQLVAGYRAGQGASRVVFLQALAHLLAGVPRQVRWVAAIAPREWDESGLCVRQCGFWSRGCLVITVCRQGVIPTRESLVSSHNLFLLLSHNPRLLLTRASPPGAHGRAAHVLAAAA